MNAITTTTATRKISMLDAILAFEKATENGNPENFESFSYENRSDGSAVIVLKRRDGSIGVLEM